jgi:Capsule polysaccharide biosynthesis protein
MKVLLRNFFPCPPVARWRKFEAMLKDCLIRLGHEISELEFDPSLPADPIGFDFRIYPHKSRREVPFADLFYKEMHMQDLFTIDHNGWGPDHSKLQSPPDLSCIDPGSAEIFCHRLCQEFLSSGHSKHRQLPLREIDSRLLPYLLAPLQLPMDDAVVLHSPLGVRDYIDTLADWADRARFNVMFKLHPGIESPEIAEAVWRRAANSRHVTVVNENIHALIAAAAGVVVLTSGVGFESLVHGKPVVTLGQCDYRWVTFCASADKLDKVLSYVSHYTPAQRQEAFNFVYFYFHHHAFQTSDDAAPQSRRRLLRYLETALQASGNTPKSLANGRHRRSRN